MNILYLIMAIMIMLLGILHICITPLRWSPVYWIIFAM